MMKTIIFTLLIYIALIPTSSLKSQQTSPLSNIEFEKVMELNGENIIFDDIPLIPKNIKLDGNRLLVLDGGDADYFKVYSYPEFKLIASYGQKGPGPDEIGFSPQISFFNSDTIEYFDYQKSTLNRIVCSDPNAKPKIIQVLHPDITDVQDAILLDGNIIAGTGSKNGKVYFFNSKTKEINYDTFIEETKPLTKKHMNIFNGGEVDCTCDRKKLVYASSYFNHFDIYSHTGQKEYTYSKASLDDQVFMQNNQVMNDNTKLHYTRAYATNNHFYLLYLGGESETKLMNMIDNKKFRCEIQQYSLKGEPENCFIFNVPTNAFCVDEKNNRIIIINPLSEEMPLVSFSTNP